MESGSTQMPIAGGVGGFDVSFTRCDLSRDSLSTPKKELTLSLVEDGASRTPPVS